MNTVYTYSMSDFKLRPLHRRRHGKRKTVAVLNQQELAERLGVTVALLKKTLDDMGYPYHVDSAGNLWAAPPTEDVRR